MSTISQTIINWYEQNKRGLPWRESRNPYIIWISEIILQQTRVNQGISYYYRFIEKFPDIYSLASATTDEVLKMWQGLGYYSRARNLHFTAQQIVKKYNGKFPDEYDELISLKGVGEYTAAAIASMAFNKPEPVLDGNVFRVLSRLYGISESTQKSSGKKIFMQKARELIEPKSPGLFNQAIMEFGALHCTPKNPGCSNCDLQFYCYAFQNNLVNELPVKKQKIKQRNRFLHYLYIQYNNNTYIEQRKQNDIWKLLYQFPLIETDKLYNIDEVISNSKWRQLFNGTKTIIKSISEEKIHLLTHQKLFARFYHIEIEQPNHFLIENYQQIPNKELDKLSVPKLIENYLTEINN
ncbi:MAG: A/G-specific adenine glycosylase [Bacteroidales bacterium]